MTELMSEDIDDADANGTRCTCAQRYNIYVLDASCTYVRAQVGVSPILLRPKSNPTQHIIYTRSRTYLYVSDQYAVFPIAAIFAFRRCTCTKEIVTLPR